ncbi:MAG: DegT/DnrJ/EryC1/StrS family aminotransferase [Candidatus Levybacteria bacterium]|nr:DegT/DnrJ/EryC1/StrS family aminotransferase [Candidatus Levybacteria bacterium]
MKTKDKYIGVGDIAVSQLAKKYVNQVLSSRRITYGPFADSFEKEFAKLHDLKYAIFCNSGTSALQVALHALKREYKWNDGDEVLVPALTFVATVNIIIQNNLTPIFIDVDPDFFDIDPTMIEKKITKRTRAIIPVHIGGLPCDMDPIISLARKHSLRIIEDSCETILARYKGKSVGSFGDFGCFSTYAAHTLVTGVGGFICTNDPKLATLAKSLVNHGRDGIYISIDDDNVSSKKKLFSIVDKRFNFVDVGYSYRATEFEAALGLAQIRELKENVKKRRENAAYLFKGLSDLQEFLQFPKERKEAIHTYMFFPIIVRDGVSREDLVYFLEERKIETRFLLPLLSQPVYRSIFGDLESKYPVATHLSHSGFYVGCHPGLTKKNLDTIIHIFHQYFTSRKKRK